MGILRKLFSSKRKESLAEEQHQIKIETVEVEEVKCPYCGKTLEQKPQRKRKCPLCSHMICIRSGNLVTEEKAAEIDKQRQEEREERYIEDLCEKFEFSIEDFQKREKELSEKMGGAKPDHVNVILSLFNEGIVKGKYRETGIPYYEMALFLNENNRECFHFLQLAAKMRLKEYQKDKYVTHVVICAGGGCESCEKLNGKEMIVEEALETMPIPNKDCTFHLYDEKRPFCRCDYAPEVKGV